MTTTTTAPPGTVRVPREPAMPVNALVIPCHALPPGQVIEARGWVYAMMPCDGDGCGDQDLVRLQCAECLGRYCATCEPEHEHLRYDLTGRAHGE